MSQSPSPIPPTDPHHPPAAAPLTSEDRTMALLAHLLGLFTWIIGPLIVWLIKKDQSSFVDHHGRESVNFQLTCTLAYIIAGLATCLTLGLAYPLAAAIWLGEVVLIIMACVAANNGEPYRYPLCLRIL